MSSVLRPLTVPRESLRPPSTDSHGTGAVMSVLAHVLLVAALAFGVQWRTNEPEGVEAELWAATPQMAAPRAEPEPEPEPVAPPKPVVVRPPEPVRVAPPPRPPRVAERDADIAIERAEKQRREKERQAADDQRARERREQAERDRKAEAEKDKQAKAKAAQEAEKQAERKAELAAKKAQAASQAAAAQASANATANAKKQAQAENAQREKLRQDQIRRMQAQLGGTGAPDSTGTAARSAGPSASYAGRIKARIKPNIVLTDEIAGNPMAEVEVRVAVDGSILGRRIVKSSGSTVWDETVLRAIDRTGVLPRDVDGRIPPTFVISFKPLE